MKKPPVWLTRVILVAGWTLILVLPILGPTVIQNVNKRGHFYGISGAWCWIGDGYQAERLVWKKSENGLGLGCLAPWAQRDTTTVSFHVSGESGSNGARPPNTAEFNRVGKHLKKIARRLMLYPLSEWRAPEIFRLANNSDRRIGSLTNVLLFIATRHSFIQRVASVQPRIHVVTQQVTVLEDSRGAQTIHLHDMSTSRPEDQDGISEKVVPDDIDNKGEVLLQLKPQLADHKNDPDVSQSP
ncbi:hypothetical protein FRC10_009432 [Ceratobasidium sp. 414]|nr:hypothetical protein FRC10_009432 [Ceratobasidium sp. 414]